ncbi:MAG: O-antigen ligase family protein [Candidatus Sericytochromatia bacterium]|nr:O-antigen ligase family protein [Candidatus Sericytochromatia bacterium]
MTALGWSAPPEVARARGRQLVTLAAGGMLALAIALSVAELDRLALIGWFSLPLACLVFLHVEFGLACLLVYSTGLAWLIRMLPLGNTGPIGLVLDGLLLLMGVRLLADLLQRRDARIFRSPLTWWVGLFALYQGLEVLNPASPGLLFGLYGLRVTLRMLGFCLVIYYFRRRRRILRLLDGWLALLVGVACYGIFQHHHGLLWQEMAWLLSEGNAQTHILSGYVRVFSTVGDAATFGFLMAAGSLQALAMSLSASPARRLGLLLAIAPMLYGLTLSYSRGPVVALMAGTAALVLAARSWRLGLSVMVIASLGLGGLALSGSERLLDRLATATRPAEDASFNVRLDYIQQYLPEIARRPFGYGINTSGGNARKAAGEESVRDSVVGVPTDNYYFKVALELGWCGLLLWVGLNLTLLWHAYQVQRRLGDPALQGVALGLFSVLAAWLVGAFSNDIFAQKPIAEFFWMAVGLVVLLGQYRERSVAPVRRLWRRQPSAQAGPAARGRTA